MYFSTKTRSIPATATSVFMLALFILALNMLISLTGCGSHNTQSALEQETSRLKPLIILYAQAFAQNGGRPPANEEKFKSFIAKEGGGLMKSYKFDSVDDLLISERDGEPYVIFYGKRPQGVASDLCAYEKVGVDGKRYVGFTLGIVEEVDETRFRELVPNIP